MVPDRTVSVAGAKSTLSELVSAAESGETIVITRRGKPVAELRARHRPRARVDLDVLRHATAGMTPQDESAEDVVRRMRDDARY
jgi:antitoxin (DNA-binding transcriptional repressor) of toxin-antitoxin stability system